MLGDFRKVKSHPIIKRDLFDDTTAAILQAVRDSYPSVRLVSAVAVGGRCDKGERLKTHSPAGHWKITTMISAVRLAGPFAAAVVSGATDSDVFRTYVNQILTPQLSPGGVVVMDNLQPHHAAGVREAIEAAGAMLSYLPPYSPDFNPIENMGRRSNSPAFGRGQSVRRLCDASDAALASVTSDDCRGFFTRCGYAT